MKAFRVLVAGSLVLAMVVSLIACKGTTNDQGKGTSEKTTKEDTLKKNADAIDIKTAPVINTVVKNTESVAKYDKLELTVNMTATYDNPYDPDQIDLRSEFKSPSGKEWKVFGFYDGTQWKVRFSPNEPGDWTFKVSASNPKGAVESKEESFTCTASDNHGWIGISKTNNRYFTYDDGTSFYGVGLAYPWNVTEQGLDNVASHGGNVISYWNGNYDGAGNGGGTKLIESIQSGLGKYDQGKSQRIDQLLESCEKRGIKISFVIWPHDSLADNMPGSWVEQWSQNPYNTIVDAKDFYKSEEAWKYQEKLYRYMIARWGYSSSLFIWDTICEINGTDGWAYGDRKAADEWAAKVHNFFKANDPFGHPTKGSMSGSGGDYWTKGYETYDISDREIYYDLGYRTYVRETQKRWKDYDKPIITGETGFKEDIPAFHNSLWSTAVNGLAMTPLWWEYNSVNDDYLVQLQHFSKFVSDIDFGNKKYEPAKVSKQNDPAMWAMKSDRLVFGWMVSDSGKISGKTAEIKEMPDGAYNIQWYDCWTGKTVKEEKAEVSKGSLKLTSPKLDTADIAFKISPAE